MQQKKQSSPTVAVLENLYAFIVNNTLVVSIASGAVVLVVVLGFTLSMMNTNNQDKATKALDEAFSYINNISYITNDADRNKVFQDQMNNMVIMIQSYPKTIAANRARLFLGRTYFQDAFRSGKQDALNMSLSYYTSALEFAKSDFYRTLALMGRAQCYEQKNDYAKAFDDYNLVVTRFNKEGFTPAALIGLARSKEMIGDVNQALQYYQEVSKEYTNSLWSRFAKGKIYYYSEPNAQNAANKAATNAAATTPANNTLVIPSLK